MATTKATTEALNDLHLQVAITLKEALTSTYEDKDGNKIRVPASHIKEAREFLKDNDIKVDLIPATPQSIADTLPFPRKVDL